MVKTRKKCINSNTNPIYIQLISLTYEKRNKGTRMLCSQVCYNNLYTVYKNFTDAYIQ